MDDFDTSDTEFYATGARFWRDELVGERLHHFFTALGFVGALCDAAESIQEQAERRYVRYYKDGS